MSFHKHSKGLHVSEGYSAVPAWVGALLTAVLILAVVAALISPLVESDSEESEGPTILAAAALKKRSEVPARPGLSMDYDAKKGKARLGFSPSADLDSLDLVLPDGRTTTLVPGTLKLEVKDYPKSSGRVRLSMGKNEPVKIYSRIWSKWLITPEGGHCRFSTQKAGVAFLFLDGTIITVTEEEGVKDLGRSRRAIFRVLSLGEGEDTITFSAE